MASIDFTTPDEPAVRKNMGGFATYDTANDYAAWMLSIGQWTDATVHQGSSRRSPERA